VTASDQGPGTSVTAQVRPAARRLGADFLFLDLTSCTRCRATDRNLEAALEAARDLLAAAGAEVEVNKIHVQSAEQARELRFESSPTIRVNGRDVALEVRESSCGCEACTDGCGDSIACRVWVYGGREYTEPPVAMIVDAILREVYGGTVVEAPSEAKPYELPENLERFFAGKAAAKVAEAPVQVSAAVPVRADCCPPAERHSCCRPEDEADCCGASSREGCRCR
jgi:hypothetical protein